MSNINDLRGRRFGRLSIPAKAEPEIRDRRAYWPTVCDCGVRKLIRGTAMVQGRIVSCGCERADPAVRRGSRLKVSPKRRTQIARMGGLARSVAHTPAAN